MKTVSVTSLADSEKSSFTARPGLEEPRLAKARAPIDLRKLTYTEPPAAMSWLGRKIDRLFRIRHALSLWGGRLPAEMPGHLELAVTPMVRSSIVVLPLIVSDLLALLISTVATFLIFKMWGPPLKGGIHLVQPLVAGALILTYFAGGVYSVVGTNPVVEFRQLTRINTLTLILSLTATFLIHKPMWRYFLVLEWGIALPMLPLLRSITRSICSNTLWWRQPALIFGPLNEAQQAAQSMLDHPSCGLRPTAIVLDDDQVADPLDSSTSIGLPTITGELARRLVRQSRISYGVIMDPPDPVRRESEVARALAVPLSHVLIMSRQPELPSLWRETCEFAGMPAIEVQNRLIMPMPRIIKRTTDLVLTLLGGLAISPVLIALAIGVKLTSPGPIFFSQRRIGKCGRQFKAWKFRTMVANASEVLERHLQENPQLREEWERDHKLKDDPRVTRVGRILRKTSMDEFPQLWNVLQGDMSLVGPRPIVDAEIAKYGPVFDKYTAAKPGLTGMWQVSGRNNTSYGERIGFDDFYVRNWSPWLDIYLLGKTVKILVTRHGAY